jgi:hypothetical protein
MTAAALQGAWLAGTPREPVSPQRSGYPVHLTFTIDRDTSSRGASRMPAQSQRAPEGQHWNRKELLMAGTTPLTSDQARTGEMTGALGPETSSRPGQAAMRPAALPMLPGAPAAELAVMREAAAAFAQRFSGEGTPAGTDGLGMLASPFPAPPATGREEYGVQGNSHVCFPASPPQGRAEDMARGGRHVTGDQVTA